MSINLVCMRYGAEEEIEYDTVEAAISGALYMIDFNTASPMHLTDESGTIVMDEETLRARAWALTKED